MHHFVYPTQDTFISNVNGYEHLNFGLNEILRVGVPMVTQKTTLNTTLYFISSSVTNMCVTNFSGSIYNATLYGTASRAIVSITSNIVSNVTSSHFTGTLTGSYQSGSLTGSAYTGSLGNFSGSFSGIFSGSVSGSIWSDYLPYLNGTVFDFTGKIYSGYLRGSQVLNQQNTVTETRAYVNRALLQFDISSISQSVASGDIVNPRFTLKMKAAREENLPIKYTLYVYPVVESWVMGNGYFFDGGSTQGASWLYRDYNGGTTWANTGSTYVSSSIATQSFNYEVGDVSLDITNMAYNWMSGTLPNHGLVVISSEETNPTGSGMALYFFSEDSNTIYSPYVDVGWDDSIIEIGSAATSSVNIVSVNSGTTGSILSSSTFIIPGGGIYGMFSGDSFLTRIEQSISGIVIGVGESGTIDGMQIVGNTTGSSTLTASLITGSCGKKFNAYIITSSFVDGPFSGSIFTAYYTDAYKIVSASLSGSWPTNSMYATSVVIPVPSGIEPFSYAYISGPYIYGKALGTYTPYSPSSSSFVGQFIDGFYVGGTVSLQLSGSVYTSSYSYTSSVVFESTELEPMQVSTPFATVVSIPEKVTNNQIIKVNVFGREKFPLKNFQRLPQFSQFLTPLYLPSSSFYSIKDNETEEIILDFDNYTRLSCDTNGSYFMLDTSGLPQERYFKILIKVEQSGSVYIVDNNNIFKVVR